MSDAAAVAPPLVAGSYLTFHLTQAKYALPVGAIRYITELDAVEAHAVPGGKGGMTRVFTFQQEQISLYNFSRLMGAASQREECQQLVELMAQRRQDHIDWIEALEHSIETDSDFQKATDPHQCAFGRWYDSYRSRDEELKALQQKARDKSDRQIRLDDTGQVKGILCRMKREKSGTMTPVFQVGVMSRVRLKIVNTTVSITKHGRVEAWGRAVDFYCEHKRIGKRTKAYKDLIARCPKPAQVKRYTQH